jgi:hypothetical protein
MILPRQARDKHTENSFSKGIFLRDGELTAQGWVDGDEEQLLGVAQATWQTDTRRAGETRLAVRRVHALC